MGKNIEFIYTYLIEKKKIKPSRISLGIAPYGKEATELWLIPNKNIFLPTCKECFLIQAEDEEKLKEYFSVKKTKK